MTKGILFAICSATCFAFLAIFAKIGYNLHISTGDMLFLRFFIASIIFSCYFIIKDLKLFIIKKENLLKAIFAGTVLYFLQSNLFFTGVKYTSVATASLILYLYPFFVTILSIIIFKSKLNIVTSISLILIILGSCFIFYQAFESNYTKLGILSALGASIIFSCYIVFIQYALSKQNPLTFSYYVILFAAITFYFRADLSFTLNKASILLFLGLAFVSTFLAITLLYLSIEKIGSMYASIFSSIEPVITVIASILLLSERVNFIQIVGMFLIMLSILLPQIKRIGITAYE